jgi:transcriptional regulator with XRE-family HTH domain
MGSWGRLMTKKRPEPVDVEVGRRVRTFRLEKGFSQEQLAAQLGLTFQQVQKYEKGANRIGAGRLQHIADILGIPITEFFATGKVGKTEPTQIFELLNSAASLRLLRAYARIRKPGLREVVVTLLEQLADS